MRTRVLYCLAALAAGAASSLAQSNVYSLNIVGYVTYTQQASKFNIIANPLNTTNNDVSNVFSSAAQYPGLTVYKRNSGGGYDQSTFDPDLTAWTAPLDVSPGTGVWLSTPPGSTFTNTFVGEVTLDSTNTVEAGYSIKSSVVPQAGLLSSQLAYPVAPGDGVFVWNGNGYDIFSFDPDLSAWAPSEPSVNVAQGFWIFNSGASKPWVRHFTVGP
jgi:hypothetical protein